MPSSCSRKMRSVSTLAARLSDSDTGSVTYVSRTYLLAVRRQWHCLTQPAFMATRFCAICCSSDDHYSHVHGNERR